MKKDCAYTRKSLQKYLRGHLFKFEQIRIARHLNACPVCRSEFQALKKVADTKQLIQDITPPEGVVQHLKAGAAGLAKLRLLIYRPLWLLVIIGVATLVYINILAPHRDIEIENIEKTLPPAPTTTPAPGSSATLSAPVQEAAARPEPKTQPAAPAREPLMITIAPRSAKDVRLINDVLHAHGQLQKMRFTESVHEISGNLPAGDLVTFFNRIKQAGKVSYSRKRLESFPAAEPVHFIMKMKRAPKTVEQASSSSPSADKPAKAAATTPPASAPTPSAP
jgi:hypothetical protein